MTDTKTLAARLKAIAINRSIATTQTSATLSQSADRLVSLSSSLDQQITQNAEQAEEIAGLRAQVAADRDTIKDLLADKAAQQKRIAELEGQCKAWRQHYRDEHSRRLKIQQSALETEATIASLKGKVRELESQVADGTRIATELSQTIDDLQSGIGSNPTA